MDTDFSGKVALVTAAANGIGRASAMAFARQGARVMVSDIDQQAGLAVVDEILSAGGEAAFSVCDVTCGDAVKALVDGVLAKFGRLDFAHNNAGNMFGAPDFGSCSEEEWDRTIDLSLKATWLCMRAELAVMAGQQTGAIVNTTSMAGVRTSMGANAAYSAAKAGVISLTEYAAIQHAADGIRVNAIAPGLVRTKVVDSIYSKEEQDRIASQTQPIGRIIDPVEIADAVIFLCSDRAAMITGTTLPVAGGYNAA